VAATLWCPRCGDEYRAGFTVCADCGVALVSAPPPERASGATVDETLGHEPVVYDLSGWSTDGRAAIEWILRGAGIAFEWDPGDVLVVPPARADEVEGFLDYLESGAGDEPDGAGDTAAEEPATEDTPSPWWPP
jgi:hypothetical protein